MATTRTENPPRGVSEQIDELDHLLDQLLKLPIDQVRTAPKVSSPSPVHLAVLSDEDEDDSAAPETEILRFDVNDDSEQMKARTELDDELAPVSESDAASDLNVSFPTLPEIPPVEVSTSHSGEEKPSLPVSEIPWIEDEPLGNTGPRVEVVVGPTCDVVMAPLTTESEAPREKNIRRSWFFWILWAWTWCFDQTMGHWFPWLRRPGVKFVLGLVGVVLLAISIYLVWIGLQR